MSSSSSLIYFPNVTDSKLSLSAKQQLLILTILSGMIIDSMPIPLNALRPIENTEEGICVFLQPVINTFSRVSMTALQWSRESKRSLPSATLMQVSPVQPEKASLLNSLTEAGITMLVSPVQPSKARSPIYVTDSGMTMFVRPTQPLKASLSILVNDFGRTMLVKAEQPSKAFHNISVTDSGIVTLVISIQS